MSDDKTGSLAAAEYPVLLVHSTPGRCWSTVELMEMLRDTGFGSVEFRDTTGDRSVVIAHK
jgi:hypothetical protein